MKVLSITEKLRAAEEQEQEALERDLLWWHEERWRRGRLPEWRQVWLAIFSPLGPKPYCPPRFPAVKP
jgi:hypothetical protein